MSRFALCLPFLVCALSTPFAACGQTHTPFHEQGEAAWRAGRPADAFRLVRQGAERDEPRAQWLLSKMYALGVGAARDPAQAQAWKRRAAGLGEAEAAASLGIDHLEAKGPSRDDASASYWCRIAAEQGEPDGEACLGKLYEEGRGVHRDPARAAEWFAKAAAQRNASGAIGLALLHHAGAGVPKDDVAALKWLFVARDLNAPLAMTMETNPRRIFAAELRAPQVRIAAIQRVVDQPRVDRARALASAWLATPAPMRPRPGPPPSWLARSFCGDAASLRLPENEAAWRAFSDTDRLVFGQLAEAQQVRFLDERRAVILHDREPKFLCTYATRGRAAHITCPLSSYDVTSVTEGEIRLKSAGPSAFEQSHSLAQRLRADSGVCRAQN